VGEGCEEMEPGDDTNDANGSSGLLSRLTGLTRGVLGRGKLGSLFTSILTGKKPPPDQRNGKNGGSDSKNGKQQATRKKTGVGVGKGRRAELSPEARWRRVWSGDTDTPLGFETSIWLNVILASLWSVDSNGGTGSGSAGGGGGDSGSGSGSGSGNVTEGGASAVGGLGDYISKRYATLGVVTPSTDVPVVSSRCTCCGANELVS
jgi:hypothetical protein